MDYVENGKPNLMELLTPKPLKPDKNSANILDADHPLLEKFQASLKAHLLRIQSQMLEEISDLEHSIKTKNSEREEYGVKLYDMQQQIEFQRTKLDEYNDKIQDITETRLAHESNIVLLKDEYYKTSYNLKKEKQDHNKKIMDLDGLQVLENYVAKWSQEVQNEMAVAKRIISKDAQDQAIFAEEKRKAELFLFNLEAEVNRRENELKGINDQIAEQDGVIKSLQQSLIDANTDLEALQQEHGKLMQYWGQVIIAITKRDKVLTKVNFELFNEKQTQKFLESSIDGIKKASQKEMQQNERLESFKLRLINDILSLEKQLENENMEFEKIINKIERYNSLLEQTEADMKKANLEGIFIQTELSNIRLKLEKQANKKVELEERILELLQDQITTDKAGQFGTKLLRDAQEKRRALEINMSNTENNLSNILLDLEAWKGITKKLKENVQKLQKEKDETDEISNRYNEQINVIQNSLATKLRAVDVSSQELATLIAAAGGQELNPDELKASELERNIHDLELKIKEIQNFWMRLQGNVVNMTEKRATQLNEIFIERKQLLVVEQKSLKIESELEHLRADEREFVRLLSKLNTQMDVMNTKLSQKKKSYEQHEEQCELSHFELTKKLKEAETSILKMEREICVLMRDVEDSKKNVFEKHREALSWETKFKMAVDTKKFRDGELAQSSEIGCMKAEIHRMQVRFEQLKRAQEKLVQDLDNSILHREHIFDAATCREKTVGPKVRTQNNVQKLNELKNKLRQYLSEIVYLEKDVAEISAEKEELQMTIDQKQREIEDEKLQDNLIQSEIEQGMLMKQENLENIVRKQRRVKRYKTVAISKTMPKSRNENIITTDLQRQREVHEHLMGVVDGLLTEFPENKFQITRILQTLKEEE